MKRIFLCVAQGALFMACGQVKKYKYLAIVDRATGVEINYQTTGELLRLDEAEVEIFREILKDNIHPVVIEDFEEDIRVVLYEKDEILGEFRLANSQSTVCFNSGEVEFGFQLTYRIGRFLSEIRAL